MFLLHRISLLAVLLAVSPAIGQFSIREGMYPKAIPTPDDKAAFKWQLNAVGKFSLQGKPNGVNFFATDSFRVLEVISDTELLLHGERKWPRSGTSTQTGRIAISPERTAVIHQPFIFRKASTKGTVDDASLNLEDWYKVAETKKHAGKTYFVLVVAAENERPELLAMPRIQAKIVKGPIAKPIDNPEIEAQKLYEKVTSRSQLLEIIAKYPDTAAAKKCRERIAKLDKK